MFLSLDSETGYRIILRLLEGTSLKLLHDYELTGKSYLLTAFSDERIRNVIQQYSRIIQRTHLFLNKLKKSNKSPTKTTLSQYYATCIDAKRLLIHLRVDSNFVTALSILLNCYCQILYKMIYNHSTPYAVIYTNIVSELVAATLHHEMFLNKEDISSHINTARETFTILLK